MMKHLLIIIISIAASIAYAEPDFTSIGDQGGSVIGDTDYAFSIFEENQTFYVVLQKLKGIVDGEAIWENLDYISISELDEGFSFFYAMCELNDAFTPEIVAIAKFDNKPKYNVIQKAWLADLEKGKFRTIEAKNIQCINESYGHHEGE